MRRSAKGPAPKRKNCDHGTDPVVVHTPASLARKLKAEAGKERMIDERAAGEVRKLSHAAE